MLQPFCVKWLTVYDLGQEPKLVAYIIYFLPELENVNDQSTNPDAALATGAIP